MFHGYTLLLRLWTPAITDDDERGRIAGGQVTVGDNAPLAKSINMLPHTYLSYNPTTNTQYLDDDDCMRIRVVDVHNK